MLNFSSMHVIKCNRLQRLFIALYGHGFCGYLRNKMFRKILRHGAAYFDEETNTPGRLVHKLMSDTATLNRVILIHTCLITY